MTDVKLDNIFVIPIVDQPLSRDALEDYIYLVCIEHGLRAAAYNAYIALYLKRDFLRNFYVYVILFHYPVGKKFKDLALRNWNLLKTDLCLNYSINLKKFRVIWKLTGNEPWCELEKKIDSNPCTNDAISVKDFK